MTRRKKTNKEFQQEVHDLVGDDYTFMKSYQGARIKIKVRHNKCGNVYEVTPNCFLNGDRCPYCSGKMKKTNAQFKQEVFNLVGNEYTFLDTYATNKTKLRVRHNKCGKVYDVTPNRFLRGDRCPYCSSKAKKTDTQFKNEIYDRVGDEYTFLEPYVNSQTKIEVKHNKCGNTYKVVPANFIRGKRCPYCFGTHKKTDTQFKQEVSDLVGDEYTVLDYYVNSRTKIKVKHNKCGYVYKVAPSIFLQGSRCPHCSSSKGEDVINEILKSLEISYEYQKSFDNLRDVQPLSYDFYIPSQSILIEYQGIQHYQPVDYFGSNGTFEKQQKHDKMKADYAKANGYNLIAVPYTEDTFSKIKKYLIKHGLSK